MDKLITLTKLENLEEPIDDLRGRSNDGEIKINKMEVVDAELESLHHSIDIKEEDDATLEHQEDIDEGTRSHSNNYSQINTEEIELNLDKVHHHPINVQEEILVHLGKPKTKCNPLTAGEIFNHKLGDKPFKCEICDYKSAQKGYLKVHLRTHSGDKPFKCKICDYKSAQKGHLTVHLRTHSGDKLFQCEICGYKSAQKGHLKVHLRTHSGDKPFQCEICDYKFIVKGSLMRHLRTHSCDKPFQCEICNYKSLDRGSLKSHLRVHSGNKPFQCEICDCKFAVKGRLII